MFEATCLVEIHPTRMCERVFENFDLLNQREDLQVRGEVKHQPVLHIEKDGARHAIVADKRVQRIALRHPFDKACTDGMKPAQMG